VKSSFCSLTEKMLDNLRKYAMINAHHRNSSLLKYTAQNSSTPNEPPWTPPNAFRAVIKFRLLRRSAQAARVPPGYSASDMRTRSLPSAKLESSPILLWARQGWSRVSDLWIARIQAGALEVDLLSVWLEVGEAWAVPSVACVSPVLDSADVEVDEDSTLN
jgi:hypothetical protein